jgi:hypothetical protein
MLKSLQETGVAGFSPVISNFRAVGLAEILK